MTRFLKILACMATLFVSCDSNVSNDVQELDLKEQLIGLENVHNARQLGGYRIGNKTIKENLLLRSAKLSDMTEADSLLLCNKYKLQCIYDFRGKDEAVSDPDPIPGNARYLSLSLSFTDGNSQSGANFGSKEDMIKMLLENAEHPAIQAMCTNMYDIIFFEESSQEAYRKFFADLLATDPENGAVLWHCTQGKDRAGCASAMLLAALGADRNLIMADYILSKNYYDPMVSRIPVQTESQKTVINTLIGANPAIFEATLDKIDAKYGSLCNYLTQCIGVTPQMMQTLREKFLK
jgi:protein-tyrosine phosphatase